MYDKKGNKINWEDITCKKCNANWNWCDEGPYDFELKEGILTFLCDDCGCQNKYIVYRKISIRNAVKRFGLKVTKKVLQLFLKEDRLDFDECFYIDMLEEELKSKKPIYYCYNEKVLDEKLLEYTENIYKELEEVKMGVKNERVK